MAVNRLLGQHRVAVPAFIVLLLGILSSLAWIQAHKNLPMPSASAAIESPAFKQPDTFNGLLALSPEEVF